jgi:hypothetical protein
MKEKELKLFVLKFRFVAAGQSSTNMPHMPSEVGG